MRMQYLGHSVFYLEVGEHRLLIDPFIEGNPLCPFSLKELLERGISDVLITHAHGDHSSNALDFAKRGAQIISTFEIANYLGAHGAEHAVGLGIGGRGHFPWGSVLLTPAWHYSSFPDGTYGGMPTGLVLEIEGQRIYHAGDTARFGDMHLIGELGLDIALLPIGDHFTMGIADAVESLNLLRPKLAVPIHYNTFPPIAQDPAEFERSAHLHGFHAVAVKPGGWV